MAAGTTDLGGHALGAFNIRFVVVQRAPGAGRWLQQRDLALIRGEPEYSLLENVALLPRAAIYDRLPNYVRVLEEPWASFSFAHPFASQAHASGPLA